MKVFSYLRVSGKSQVDGDGFPRQREKIEAWAKLNRCQIVEEFAEEGVSGTSELADRPALSELFTAILANGVRLVVVEKADRLARDLIVSELLLRQFHEIGVKVVEAESGADLTAANDDNPTAKLIRQILAAVAEFDKTSIVLKLRAARTRKRREDGRCEGRKPFGDRPGEAEAIKRMKALRRKPKGGERLSFAEIAATLNAEGVASRTGKPWAGEVVRRILSR
jgi:DNA invertase Pin-like site-specific DNA recombinase